MSIHWVETSGGPLVCAEPTLLSYWRGTSGSSIGDERTDYERACDQLDYLSLIPCGESQVLVLGDEPMQSAFIEAADGFLIVRWISCVSVYRAEQALNLLPAFLSELEPRREIEFRGEQLCMCDSSLSGSIELAHAACVKLVPGVYQATTERYSAQDDFDFLIHRFEFAA